MAAREWPNKSKWARDDAAVLFQEIVRKARILLKHTDPAVRLQAALILDDAQRGRSFMVAVGAEVRDDDL